MNPQKHSQQHIHTTHRNKTMLRTHINQSQSTQTHLFLQKPFIFGDANASLAITRDVNLRRKTKNVRLQHVSRTIKAAIISTEKSVTVKAVVTVQKPTGGIVGVLLDPDRGLDKITELLGKSLLLELVAADLDPKTGLAKPTVKAYARRDDSDEDEVMYESEFVIPEGFGAIGGILVENEHHNEMFVKDIVIQGFPDGGTVTISCNSWVHPKYDNPEKRLFFINKSYLPSQTPSGLKKYREIELKLIRGDGLGERKSFERIYDYDVYNDLGDPDAGEDCARPILGGKQYPYPRRCRTGRPKTKTDPFSESRSASVYVPRDEAFSEVKSNTFGAKTVYSALHALVPALGSAIVDSEQGFPYFTAIDSLFNEGVHLKEIESKGLSSVLPRLMRAASSVGDNILLFQTPELVDRDKFAWFRDQEFARQILAGLNPCMIQLVKEWPLKSALDPAVYGPPESAITKELVEQAIRGHCTLEEALADKKLFIVDYHDILMPYVNKVREIEGTTLYGSRALFFLNPSNTLRPLAIELVRPPVDGKPQWKEVFAPSWDATGMWLWRLAKAHFLAHDSGIHQLVSHWLRTHCATEPYIIATNRQLSAMHPIYRLLKPHFRYTMEINALARQYLINANGIIENSFSPRKYSTELSSVAYDLLWQFDKEGLPADLIHRGMAVEDPSAPHGLKLTIEDYPYANDGLVLWDSIKEWVSDYVNHYYPEASLITSDTELQAWWTEIRTVGHGDKKDEPWWPVLKTPDDLIGILTTMIWVPSGHHAAVNFGQFDFAGYFPNRGTIARTKMPTEDPTEEEMQRLLERPEDVLMDCFPSQLQATTVLTILDVLSNHSPDEEYIGDKMEPFFEEDPVIKAAFERFSGRCKELEGIIDARNADRNLRNRTGAGIVPYELLKPFSEPGVTGQGVPNSISI